ncbi:prolyl oligopeptidase family serine peptidase [soil metagenome]
MLRTRPVALIMSALLVSVVLGFPGRSVGDERRASEAKDPHEWLEEIDGAKPLAWVAEQNKATEQRLTALPEYQSLYREALAVLDSKSRIPEVTQRGEWLYNFWRDAAHPRGLFRRATLAEFRKEQPAWEAILDIDALSTAEGKPWSFGGASWLAPDNQRCLVRLAPEGGDAVEVREFDVATRSFVADGFRLPTAKSRVAWCDKDSLYVATNFGPGTLTQSGYPRVVKLWRRGTPLATAQTLYEAPTSSVSVSARRLRTTAGNIDLVTEGLTTWTAKHFQIVDGQLKALNLPASIIVLDGFRGRLLLKLRDDWTIQGVKYAAGSIVLCDPATVRGAVGVLELVAAPTKQEIIESAVALPDCVFVTTLDNVRGRLYRYTPGASGWSREAITFPDNGSLRFAAGDNDSADILIQYESFLEPPSLYLVKAGTLQPELLKSQAPTFDGSRFEVRQFSATSADGTKIPYFVVGSKTLKLDGKNPVWMFSYGGFEIVLKPAYSGSYEDLHGAYGKLWLKRGGVFVLANIRGGGEFGPAWHQAALLENHVRCFEDFEAVARDLSARKISSPAHIGIEGRSNGGLLVGATMVRHPELYGAVVCGNPLLDMMRYHLLLAGASWAAEYGSATVPAQAAFLSKCSPYQNVKAGQKLPPVIFYTTTRDDRVHPCHARKMAAKMEALSYPVEYFENTEGGHHGSVTNEQLAKRLALTFTFLWSHLR